MKKKNYHLFEIKGVNQERFFNNLVKRYKIFELDRKDKTHCSFKVNYRDAKKVRAEILNAGLTIEKERSKSLLYFLTKFLTCYGILSAIVICSCFYFIQFSRIERIEVWGDYDSELIKEFVEQNLQNKNKNRVDCQKIENLINNEFDDLSFVSVAIVGQTMVVNVKSSIVPPEMQGEFAPIISPSDGIVREINLIQGTLKVDVGDIIQKGQILVEGYVINSEGESMDLQPRAEIVLDVWAEGESVHFDQQLVTSRTGNKTVRTSVTLFGHEFYSNNAQVQFDQYEEEQTSKPLIKNNLLPFILTKTTYYETQTQLVVSSFAEHEQEMISQARENCLQNLAEYEIIKDENYRIIEAAGTTTVKYVITASLRVVG